MKAGDRVYSPDFGRGEVIAVERFGHRERARVDFVYTTVNLFTEQLQLLSSAPAKIQAGEPAEAQPPRPVVSKLGGSTSSTASLELDSAWRDLQPLGPPEAEARMGIIALRLGQVLESQILNLSVGTDEMRGALTRELDLAQSGSPRCVVLEGAWGGGKTHALTLLQALARARGMVIAGTVMDGLEVTFSNPTKLMEAILVGLQFPGTESSRSLADLLRHAKSKGKAAELRRRGASELAAALESVPGPAFDDPEALQLIDDYFCLAAPSGHVSRGLKRLGYPVYTLPSLRVRSVVDRAERFAVLLRNWATFSAVLGARGLLVVLDELDVEYATTGWDTKACEELRFRRTALLQELWHLMGDEAPLLLALGCAPGGGEEVDPENDAVADVVRALAPRVSHLKVPEPTDQDLRTLLGRLVHLYDSAYDGPTRAMPEGQIDELHRALLGQYHRKATRVPRHFVRLALEACDVMSVGGKSFGEVLGLLRTSVE